jgi:NitT/TauT family transport system substrate-binding protein
LLAGMAACALPLARPALAQARTDFKVGWSMYVGWMPCGYASDAGIVQKWADKYGRTIEVTQFNGYVESLNQYTAGAYYAVTVNNMDALSIPAAGGVDTTAVIVGDFSAGNDAVFLKGAGALADIAGRRVNLVEFSVSHYLLARALDSVGAFQTADVQSMATWNPMVAEIGALSDAT